MMEQDSSEPSGVKDNSERGNSEVARARDRKANAALQMCNAGANWIEIAETLGYPTPRTAKVAVELALEKQLYETDREKLRAFVASKYDRLLRGIWARAIDENHPDQIIALREARAIIADQVKLWGLAAPSEVIVTSPSTAELERWVSSVVATTVPQLEEGDIFDVEVTEDDEAV